MVGSGPNILIYLVHLVHLVCLVGLVYLVGLVDLVGLVAVSWSTVGGQVSTFDISFSYLFYSQFSMVVVNDYPECQMFKI